MMRRTGTMLALLGCLTMPAGAAPMTTQRAAAIDAAVGREMARKHANGMALALVEDGKVVLVRSYGARNAAGAPLQPTTIMYGASLTKAVFAYTVMRLVDEGRLSLDEPIAALLAKPLPGYGNLDAYGNWGDLASDERWRRLTPRILLTHSGGFANFSFLEPDQKLKFHWDPGARYGYSGEGLILLPFAIEQRLGHGFEAEAERLTFGPLRMRDTSLIWRPAFAGNLADGWAADGTAVAHDRRERVRVAGSMDTTIADLARFAAAVVSGTGLSARSHAEMLKPQLPITTGSQFPTLQPELPPSARWPGLAAGLGVVTFARPQGEGFFKGGHDDQTANTMVCVRRGRRCALILGNDVRIEAAFPTLVEAVLGDTGAPWRWEYPEQFEAK